MEAHFKKRYAPPKFSWGSQLMKLILVAFTINLIRPTLLLLNHFYDVYKRLDLFTIVDMVCRGDQLGLNKSQFHSLIRAVIGRFTRWTFYRLLSLWNSSQPTLFQMIQKKLYSNCYNLLVIAVVNFIFIFMLFALIFYLFYLKIIISKLY